jgi:hypothetical protein
MPSPKHKWEFAKYFRADAYGWKGTAIASKRIKEALAEIKKHHKNEPITACEGIVIFFEKLVPSIAQIDSSSGSLGNATDNAVEILTQIFGKTEIDFNTREQWLERIYDAYTEDGYGYLDNLGHRFGIFCREKKLAESWALKIQPMKEVSFGRRQGYFKGSIACLSCLLEAEKYKEILELLKKDEINFWSYRVYGVRALGHLGKIKEALMYANESKGDNDSQATVDLECEKILLGAGQVEEAYQLALNAYRETTNLGTFKAIKKQYPSMESKKILDDLIDRSGDKGKWFATAKEIGELELAQELISKYPCDPLTIIRAAQKFQKCNPKFSIQCSFHSLRWMIYGGNFKFNSADVITAYKIAIEIGEGSGGTENVKGVIRSMLEHDEIGFVSRMLEGYLK